MSGNDFELVLKEIQSPKATPCPRSFIQGWFLGLSYDQISREDLLKWTFGICFNTTLAQLDESDGIRSDRLVEIFENLIGHKFVERPSTQKMILLTTDPSEIVYRPMLFYGVTNALDICIRGLLSCYRFKRFDEKHCITYYRKGRDEAASTLVFFHGIGLGLVPYIRFILSLVHRFPNRSILLFEMPFIAMKLSKNYCLPKKFSRLVFEKCQELKVKDLTLIGHSLGTIMIRWMDHYYPELVSRRVFIDPICFALWTSDIAYNFLYRKPAKFMQYFIKYMASTEPGIALYFRRFFIWYENTYFSENLPENSSIYLSENDDVVNTEFVSNYLNNHHSDSRKIFILENSFHGKMIAVGDYTDLMNDLEFGSD
jgi:hypothetical protein